MRSGKTLNLSPAAGGTVDKYRMRPARIPSALRFFPATASVVLALLAAGAVAADRTDANAGPAEQIAARGSLLQRLLTWPKEEDDRKTEGDKDKEAGEKKDEDDNKEEPLESDRPNFTQSSKTVGAHRFQVESGWTFIHGVGGDASHDSHDLPELLLRYGLAERLELRVEWTEGIVFDRFTDRSTGRVVTETGSTDMDVGFKYAISKQDRWRPESALIVSVFEPVGSPQQSSRQADVVFNYCYSWDLTKKLALGCSTGCFWTAEQGDHFSQFFQSACLQYDLTEKLHVYNEWFVLLQQGSGDDRPQHYDDAGVTYLVTPNLQLDWRAGVGLSDAADRFFTGCGVTVRR
jgi:hypothetical protein